MTNKENHDQKEQENKRNNAEQSSFKELLNKSGEQLKKINKGIKCTASRSQKENKGPGIYYKLQMT